MKNVATARFTIKSWLHRTGVFENGLAKESYFVIPGSGTGDLRGLRGEGTSAVGHGTEHPLTLNYELG